MRKKKEILEKTIQCAKDEELTKKEIEEMVVKIEIHFIKEAVNVKHANILILEKLKVVSEEKLILEGRLE